MTPLTIALPKGRLLKPTLDLLANAGFTVADLRGDSRKLIVDTSNGALRFLLLKPFDVITFVEYGAADVGIVGQDVLLEHSGDVYEPCHLPFGHCRIVLAARAERAATDWRQVASLRIATKYPRVTRNYFVARGWSAEIIPLHGSVEIAPALNLCDLVVDIVDTGRTLHANGLIEVEAIAHSQAALIVNRAAYTLRHAEIQPLLRALAPTEVPA